MTRQHAFQSAATQSEQPHGDRHLAHRRREIEPATYTIAEVCERISMARSTFYRLRDQGELPFIEEVQPRVGRLVRYRRDLVDEWCANRFNRNASASTVSHGRHRRAVPTSTVIPKFGTFAGDR